MLVFEKTRRIVELVIVIGVVSCSAVDARAAILYALADFDEDTGRLYTIDTDDGSTSLVGVTTVAKGYGLADYNGRLFSYDQQRGVIVEINPTTGGEIRNQSFGPDTIGEGGIAIDSSGMGYVADSRLYSFVLGAAGNTDIGELSDRMDGLDFQPATDVLYGLSQASSPGVGGSLFTINLTTATTTEVGASGITTQGGLAGLTFDEAGDLYAITEDGRLFSVNQSTGGASLLWTTELSQVSGLSSVRGVVPEPTSIVMWLVCCLFAGWSVWRRPRRIG